MPPWMNNRMVKVNQFHSTAASHSLHFLSFSQCWMWEDIYHITALYIHISFKIHCKVELPEASFFKIKKYIFFLSFLGLMLHNFVHVAYAVYFPYSFFRFYEWLVKINNKILTEIISDRIWGFHGSEDSYCSLLDYDTV